MTQAIDEMDARTIARETMWGLVGAVLGPAVLARGAAHQLAYLWATGDHPTCERVTKFRADVAVRLERIKPWATPAVRLGSTALALFLAAFVTAYFSAANGTITTPSSALAWVGLVYLLGQWSFLLLFDPLYLAVHGRDRTVEEGVS